MRPLSLILFLFIAVICSAQKKKSTSQPTLQQADSLFQAREWKAAAPLYEAVLKAKPENSLAWDRLGFSYHNLFEYDKALSNYLKSLEQKSVPQVEVVVQARLARVFSIKHENDMAFKSLDKALALGYSNLSELDTQKGF